MIDLRSKARQRLLAYYFANPTARLHLRDLAQRLSIDASNLSKELGRLEREGLFRSELSGRQKYFQLNREYPLFAEVRSIVSKTIGARFLMAQSLEKIEGIEEAYLYGSFASNQQDAASDKTEKKTCRSYQTSGTRMKPERLCLTKEEWRKFDADQ